MMTGETVLHYDVRERLGAGGMGEVYRALDTRLGREVALKFLSPGHQQDPQKRDRLLREARAASLLRSPNIAVTYDLGELNDSLFIVMEYVQGELVSQRLTRGPLEIPEALDIAAQVADALDEAHGHGIVHRDIKSANLIVTDRGLVKVLDFGLAKFMPDALAGGPDGRTRLQETGAGVVLGTVFYMSPEQILGRTVDHRSDLFSLGVVMYEMTTGRVPFEGDSLTAVADRILHHEPAALSRFNVRAPDELEGIVRKALSKDPAFRYQSARDLYIDVRALLRRVQGGDARPEALGRTTVFQHGLTGAAGPENGVAVMTFANITKEAVDDWIGSGIAETVTTDLKNVHGLTIISRAQVFEVLKNLTRGEQGIDDRIAIDVGRQLGASWIVSGGYQRLGDVIRITAHLMEVRSGALVRTVKVDGRIADIFELQDRIVYDLSQGLNLTLKGSEIAQIEQKETASVEAYEAYSRGMLSLRAGSRDSLDRAVYLFEKATEHDPAYASAWAALGAAYDLKASFLNLPELAERAIRFERRAIELNPRLADAYRWLGGASMTLGRVDDAMEAYRQALQIDPQNAAVHSSLGRAFWLGKGQVEEGIEELEQAIALNPDSGYAYLQLAMLYVMTGRFDAAARAAQDAIALQEKATSGREGLQIVGAHARLGYVRYREGRYDEAIREYERELAFLASSDHSLSERTGIELYQKLGAAHLARGEAAEAARYFELSISGFERRLAKGADDPFTKYYVAAAHALTGNTERAIRYLEESSRRIPHFNRLRLRDDPDFESVRQDPRVRALIEA